VVVVGANGLEIAYECVGEGPSLVLAHGAASDSRLWGPQLAGLADEFRVVAWDDPGAGRSADVRHPVPAFGRSTLTLSGSADRQGHE
jgi:pimeloyl-ACP methyl ester carboxylesterase